MAVPGTWYLRTHWDKGAQLNAALVDAADRSRSTGASVDVDLRVTAGFAWDQLFVIGPYTTADQIQDMVGVPVARRRLNRIDARDDVVLLLFLNRRDVIADVAFRREHADFLPMVRAQPYTPHEAVVTIGQSSSGGLVARQTAA